MTIEELTKHVSDIHAKAEEEMKVTLGLKAIAERAMKRKHEQARNEMLLEVARHFANKHFDNHLATHGDKLLLAPTPAAQK